MNTYHYLWYCFFIKNVNIFYTLYLFRNAGVTNMSNMFYNCSLLESLPDIFKWNTNKVTDMRYIFAGCSSLKSLPDISKWNTSTVKFMSDMFYKCNSLERPLLFIFNIGDDYKIINNKNFKIGLDYFLCQSNSPIDSENFKTNIKKFIKFFGNKQYNIKSLLDNSNGCEELMKNNNEKVLSLNKIEIENSLNKIEVENFAIESSLADLKINNPDVESLLADLKIKNNYFEGNKESEITLSETSKEIVSMIQNIIEEIRKDPELHEEYEKYKLINLEKINEEFIATNSDDVYQLLISLPYKFIKRIYISTILPVIEKLPECIKWKFLIEQKYHNYTSGRYVFNKNRNCTSCFVNIKEDILTLNNNSEKYSLGESGYIENGISSFDYMLETLGQSLIIADDKDLLLELYKKCMENTKTRINKKDKCCNNYRKNGFEVQFGGVCPESIREQAHLRQKGTESEKLANFKINENGGVFCNDFSKIDIPRPNDKNEQDYVSKYFAQKIFSDYYRLKKQLDETGRFETMLSSEEDPYEIKLLELITRTMEVCDYSHIFPDGNGRIFGFIVLNKLLMEIGWWPTMISNGWDICLPISKKFANGGPTYSDKIIEGQKYFIKQLIEYVKIHYQQKNLKNI